MSYSDLKDLCRGAVEIIGEDELNKKLSSAKTLRVKHGVDPTAPDLHLGYAVNYQVMRRFQDAGHTAVIILGDFTARIGDPTDKLEPRTGLKVQQIKENAKSMLAQMGRILRKDRLEMRRNSEWWGRMKLEEFLKIAKNISAARLWERDMFQQRLGRGRPVWTHEFLYPILQGYDSVAIEADLTVVGSDQKFNELVARDVQGRFGQQPQSLVVMPILTGLDGKEKMSQSLGNYVGLADSPQDMFGKLMSMPDSNVLSYAKLLTDIDVKEVEKLMTTNPRDAKALVTRKIVARFHSSHLAISAQQDFERVFQEKQLPKKIPTIKVGDVAVVLVDLLIKARLASSRSQARRVISEGGVRIDGQIKKDPHQQIKIPSRGLVIQRGKRHFARLIT